MYIANTLTWMACWDLKPRGRPLLPTSTVSRYVSRSSRSNGSLVYNSPPAVRLNFSLPSGLVIRCSELRLSFNRYDRLAIRASTTKIERYDYHHIARW